VEYGGARGLDDVGGGGEVGLAGRVGDDGSALCLKRFGFRVDLERGGFGDGSDAGGDPGLLLASHVVQPIALVAARIQRPYDFAPWRGRGPRFAVRERVTYT